MRVFLDTNVLVSAITTRGLCADEVRAAIESHHLVVSEPLFDELRRVLDTKFGIPAALVDEIVWLLRQDALVGEREPLIMEPVPDPDDVPILSSAVNGGAEVFVTGDRELLHLSTVSGMEVVSPRAFWERLPGHGAQTLHR